MSTFDWLAESLVHVAALLSVAAMFFRSQLMLRWFLLAGTALNAVYFFVVPAEVLWGPVFWSVVMFVVNGAMIGLLLLDKTMFGLGEDETRLYRTFGVFTPGEYRSLMRIAAWHTAPQTQLLTSKGAPVDRLFYVQSGDIRVAKTHAAFPIGSGTFIGEVAFLRGTPASATVSLSPGARYVAWDRTALQALLARKPSIRIALGALLNDDMACKVAAESSRAWEPLLALA